MTYKLKRSDKYDEQLFRTVHYVAEKYDKETALKKLDEIENSTLNLINHPFLGQEPRFSILRKQGMRVLYLSKDIVVYKVDEINKVITLYAFFDYRTDYIDVFRGL